MEKVAKGSTEEVKEDTEGKRVTKEVTQEAKEGTRDGTSQEVTKEPMEEVKEASSQGLGQPLPGAYSVNIQEVYEIGEVPGDHLPSERERDMEERRKEETGLGSSL